MKMAYTKDKNRNFEYILKNIKCSFMSRLSFEFYSKIFLFISIALKEEFHLVPMFVQNNGTKTILYLTLK